MKIFQCGQCDHSLFFENVTCENCGHRSGYRDTNREMLTFSAATGTLISDRSGAVFKYCRNHADDACNWLLPINDAHEYCSACQLNRTVPNLTNKENLAKWHELEVAKHRLVYQLQRLGLPVVSKLVDDSGLCFDFVERGDDRDLMTGHADGVITILLSEADSVIREQNRKHFNEPYRTLIGHLRHEVGHYYWDRIIATNEPVLEEYRKLFGDERADYGEALQAYYEQGPPVNWRAEHISAYATSHSWEDWAETWAHYLHIMDTVETAHFFGITVSPAGSGKALAADVSFNPYEVDNFMEIVETSIPLFYAVNSINRAMGISDVYPFVISPAVTEKLAFIHRVVRHAASKEA